MVIDAEVVDSLKVFRQEGRIEVIMNINKEGDDGLKGILVCHIQLSVPHFRIDSFCSWKVFLTQLNHICLSKR